MLVNLSGAPFVGRKAKRYIIPVSFGLFAGGTTLAWISFLGLTAYRAITWTFGGP